MDFDNKNTMALQKQISELSTRGIPIAVQQTLTATARHAWRYGRENTGREFSNRNTWTKRSQTWQRAEGLDVDKMEAIVGSSAAYMAQQEEGFSQTGNGDKGAWIPTADAADQSGDRTKPVKFKYRRGKIRLRRKVRKRASSPKQQRLLNMIGAVKGNGYFWGSLSRTEGMWKLDGSVVNGRLVLTGVRLLYSANKRTVRTPATEWHWPAVEKAIRVNEGDEYHKALNRQVKRLKRKYK